MDRNSIGLDRDSLVEQIKEWNANRLDLFALTLPDERLEFHGVMRFFYQDTGAKVATKCVRVGSSASTPAVIDTLIEKFRPDMRMLTMDRYCLYEVHANREERKIEEHERPLLVQLNWGKDDREGRFLLKREADVTAHMEGFHERSVDVNPLTKNDKKRLSKREKKDLKKKEKQAKLTKGKENETPGESLYKELPETSFTRTISNPDAVMRRRRQQKLEKKMQEFRAKDGGPDGGGTLKVFGHTLNADVPYKTLLLSTEDPADFVVKETLEKYQMEKADPNDYCLYMLHLVPAEDGREGNVVKKEEILNEDECPLAIQLHHHPARGSLLFEIRKTPPNAQRRPRSQAFNDVGYPGYNSKNLPPNKLPFLVELQPDGTEPYNPVRHRLQADVLEIGVERSMQSEAQHLRLVGRHILPHHAVINHSEGVVTLTPLSPEAETYVQSQRVTDTVVIQDGMTIRFGKTHLFRFMDPLHEEKLGRRLPNDAAMQYDPRYDGNFDGSFDVEGHVEASLPPGARLDRRPMEEPKRSPDGGSLGPRHVDDDQLPGGLQFMEEVEDHLLSAVILNPTIVNTIQFKLAPTYTLYMAVRYRLSRHYRPEMSREERTHRMADLVHKMATMVQDIVKDNPEDANILAFWMANASELLHFFKKDDNISPYTAESLDLLAGVVQMAFRSLVNVLQTDLDQSMSAFLDEANPDDEIDDDADDTRVNEQFRNRPVMSDVIGTLSAAMGLMRRCRVNAALTIQLFSLLFHYVNMWLFNRIILEPRLQLCSLYWGVLLKRRLARIEIWAEKQGLELAADCHLARIVQAAYLLQCPKYSPDDATNISALCFKLNSLQIRVLLQSYIKERDEPYIPQELITRLVRMAEGTADEMIRSEGRNVHLEEDPDLYLPFLLPEDGYSCEIINDIPNGLPEFIDPLNKNGLCMLIPHQNVSGAWTIYMDNEEQSYSPDLSPQQHPSPSDARDADLAARNLPPEPDVILVQFDKVRGSLGLSIVAAQGELQKERGVYVKAVVPGGAAALDGRIQAGDQMLEVDGRNLIGLTQEEAAKLMTQTGNRVTLKIAVQGAIYHGLETMLSKPSPPMNRAADARVMLPPGDDPRNKPPQFGSRENMAPGFHGNQPGYPGNQRGLNQQMVQSRSTPALNDQFVAEPHREEYPPGPHTPGKDRSRSVSSLNRQEPPFDDDRRRLQSTGSAFPANRIDPRFNHASSQPALNLSHEEMQPVREEHRYRPLHGIGERPMPGMVAGERPGMVPIERPMSGMVAGERPGMVPIERPMPGMVERPGMVPVERPMPGMVAGAHPGVQMRHLSDRPLDRPKSAMLPSNREENFRQRPKSEDIDIDIGPDWRQTNHIANHVERNSVSANLTPLHISLNEFGKPLQQLASPSRRDEPSSFYENAARKEPVNTEQRHSFGGPPSPNDPRFDNRIDPRDPRFDPRMQDPRVDPRMDPRDPRNDPRDARIDPRDPRIDPRDSRSDIRDPRIDSRVDPRTVDPRTVDPRTVDPRTVDPRTVDPRTVDPRTVDPRTVDPRTVDPKAVDLRRDPREIRMEESRVQDLRNPDPRFQDPRNADPRNQGPRNPDPRNQDPRNQDPRFHLDLMNQGPRSKDPRNPEPRRPDLRIDDEPQFKDGRIDWKPSPRSFEPPKPELKIDPGRPRLSVHARLDPGQLSPNSMAKPQSPSSPQRSPEQRDSYSERYDPRMERAKSEPRDERPNSMSRLNRSASPDFPPPPELPAVPPPEEEELPPPPPPPQNYQPAVTQYQPYTNRYSGSYALINQPAPFGERPNQITSVRFQPPKPVVQPKPDRSSMSHDPNRSADIRPTEPRMSASEFVPNRLSTSEVPNHRNGLNDRLSSSSSLQQPSPRNSTLLAVAGTIERSPSPWDRDRREDELKRQEEELARMKDEEVALLESKPSLTPEEQARLHRLRLDQEFRRRVAELPKDDEEEDENEIERQERLADRERMVKIVKEDLERSHRMKQQRDELERQDEIRREIEHQQKQEHRLSLFEKEREEARQKQQRKQEKQEREQEQLLRKQREMHEKARQEQEDNRRFIQEEEKRSESKRLEELRRKKDQERQQLREMEAAREAEEEEKRKREKLALIRQDSREEFHKPSYLLNFPQVQSAAVVQTGRPASPPVPQPPARGSSYGLLNRGRPEVKEPNLESDLYLRGFQPARVDTLPNKKSVSFDARLATEITEPQATARFAAPEPQATRFAAPEPHATRFAAPEPQRFPPPTVNRYEPPSTADRYEVVEPANQYQQYSGANPQPAVSANRPPAGQYSAAANPSAFQQANQQAFNQFGSNNVRGPPPATPPKYGRVPDEGSYVVKTTPGVVGAQEVYRDPRDRAMAAKHQGEDPSRPGEQLSFRDKMKLFAETAGENAPKSRVKSSRSQRVLEMNLAM